MNQMNELSKVASQLPWYEKAIAAVAPSYGNQRLTARLQRHLFAYQGGRSDRLYAPKRTGQPAESYQTSRDRITMMWESLDLVENFPLAKSAVTTYSKFLTPTEYAPATGDRKYDALVGEYFHDWCKRCDITGRNSFRKMIQIATSMRPTYGDCGFALRRKEGELRLQLVSGDRIGNPNEATGDFPRYFSGVVVDDYGAPTAYRIYQVDSAGQYIDPEDVPAHSFLHYYDPFRADQYRGVTDFHAVLRTSRMLKEILDAEMAGVRFSSQQAALVFTERGQPQSRNLFTPENAPTMANGEQPKQEESQIGTIKYLFNGDKVETMPARPSSAFSGFVDELKNDIALGLGGYPAGVLWGTANYKGPSVRAEFAQADRANSYHQGILDDKVLSPVARAVILDAIANDILPAPPARNDERPEQAITRATRGNFRFPPRLTIDVGRETQSRLAELSMGATSPQELAAEDGRDAYVRAEEKADFAAFVADLAKERNVPESSIFLPAGQTLPNNPAQAASVGNQTGKDASEAEAAKIAQPQDGAAQGNPGIEIPEEIPDEVAAEISILNGAQIDAVLSVLEKLRGGDVTSDAAKQLIASVGMQPANAAKIVDSINTLPPAEIPEALNSIRGRAHLLRRNIEQADVAEIEEQLDREIIVSYEDGSYIPNKVMASNAKRALEIRETKPASQRGMTAVGLARARDISNRRGLSYETVKRMKAYFDRHEIDKEGSTWNEQGKGWQAWNGWGGDAGRAWAEKIVEREESKIESETKEQSMELAGMEVVSWMSRDEQKPVENNLADPTVRTAFAGYNDAVTKYRKNLHARLEAELEGGKN
jgi:capsid protein